MRAYVVVTGLVFGLLVIAHLARLVLEGPGVVEAFFLLTTGIAAGLFVWACLVLRGSSRPRDGL
jgi:hypothetical protein